MPNKLLQFLKLPEYDQIQDLDDPHTTTLHAQIIRHKPILKRIYQDVYLQYKHIVEQAPGGHFVELGSGGGFVKAICPMVKTSDVVPLQDVDYCFSADDMPFENNSVDGFFMYNVFHHIKDSTKLLKEFERCLKPGGTVLMIEPANTAWSRFIYKNFHHEPFDPSAGWTLDGEGRLSVANGALPWIVFCRDGEKFGETFPGLCICDIRIHTPLRYLASGGFSLKQLLPACSYPLLQFTEGLLTPLNRFCGMFMTVCVTKSSRVL